jgi:myo-inositol 2-dehydrogenase/D-chiro-inositol 1-dehydrogenase
MTQEVSTNRKIKFGLIGYGAWGAHHARAIQETVGAELVAIAARSVESQAAAREAQPQSEVVGEYRDLLVRSDIDVVDIVVPTHLHHEMACAALKAGKHVLLEKPMAANERDCADIISLAKKHQRILAIGFELRMSRLWARVKQMIDEGAIGEPQYCLIELWRRPYRPGSGGWRFDIDRVGNWILEEPIHFFDLARWYLSSLGDPISVTARAKARNVERPELTDNFTAILDFPGGGYAMISQTLSGFEHHHTAKVTGSKGALWASWSGAMDRTFAPEFFLKYHDGSTVQAIDCGGPAGEVFELVQQIERVADAVRNEVPVHASGDDGLWAVRMCMSAAEAAAGGATVKFV